MVIISNQLYFIDDFNHLNLFEDHLQKKVCIAISTKCNI